MLDLIVRGRTAVASLRNRAASRVTSENESGMDAIFTIVMVIGAIIAAVFVIGAILWARTRAQDSTGDFGDMSPGGTGDVDLG